jgi:hypothetical protein
VIKVSSFLAHTERERERERDEEKLIVAEII